MSMIFVALVVAFEELDEKASVPEKIERATSGDALIHANPAMPSNAVSLNVESPIGEITSGQATGVIAPQMKSPESTQTPVFTLASQANQPDLKANANPQPSVDRQTFARAIRPKIHNIRHRPSLRLRVADIKMRLIALWHRSLSSRKRFRTPTMF